jgi:DNA-binding transcriptional MerR regulator
MLPIGRFSKLCRISIKALRHYDEIGLLPPAEVDPATGYRYYSAAQVQTAERIKLLRSLEMPLDEIRALLLEPEDGARARMERHLRRVEERLTEQREVLGALKTLVYGPGGEPTRIAIRQVAAQTALSLSAGSSYEDRGRMVGKLILRLYAALGEADVAPAGPPLAQFLDSETDDENANDMVIRAAVPVTSYESRPAPPLEVSVFPAELAAAVVHTGPYSGLLRAFQTLSAWVADHGHEAAGALREVYLVGPGGGGSPADYKTELLLPIRAASSSLARGEGLSTSSSRAAKP